MKSSLSEHVTCQKENSQDWDWFDTLQWYKCIQQLLLCGDVCLGCPGASLLAQQAPKPTEPGTHYTDLSGWLLQNEHIDLIWCMQGCTTKINHWQTTQDGISLHIINDDMNFSLEADLPHLAFTRVSLDILANISAVSTNSMDCLSKIVEMAWKAKNTDNTSHVAIFISIIIHCHFLSGCNEKGTCCKLVQWARKR